MTDSTLDGLPPEMATLLGAILSRRSPDLLRSLSNSRTPSPSDRVAVEAILVNEFTGHLDNDSEPTNEGKLIDDLLGSFLRLWPIEPGDR